jgi:hypothetical protein
MNKDRRDVNEIIDVMHVLLDELARRLDPDLATAVLREHGFKVSSVEELRWLINGVRPQMSN